MSKNDISVFELAHSNNIYITKKSIERNWEMPTMHYHPDYEIFYVIDGGVSLIVNDMMYSSSQGDILLISPNSVHRTIYRTHNCTDRFELCFSPIILNNETLKLIDLLLMDPHKSVPLKYQSKVLSLFQNICEEVNESELPFNQTLATSCMFFFILAIRVICCQ